VAGPSNSFHSKLGTCKSVIRYFIVNWPGPIKSYNRIGGIQGRVIST